MPSQVNVTKLLWHLPTILESDTLSVTNEKNVYTYNIIFTSYYLKLPDQIWIYQAGNLDTLHSFLAGCRPRPLVEKFTLWNSS